MTEILKKKGPPGINFFVRLEAIKSTRGSSRASFQERIEYKTPIRRIEVVSKDINRQR